MTCTAQPASHMCFVGHALVGMDGFPQEPAYLLCHVPIRYKNAVALVADARKTGEANRAPPPLPHKSPGGANKLDCLTDYLNYTKTTPW